MARSDDMELLDTWHENGEVVDVDGALPDAEAASAAGAATTTAASAVPLVELSLTNITYAPVARTAGGGGGKDGGCSRLLWRSTRGLLPPFRHRRPSKKEGEGGGGTKQGFAVDAGGEEAPASSAPSSAPSVASSNRKKKTVLHSVSTAVSPYKLSAWMGPSGSGKTSLMTVAAGLARTDDLIGNSRIAVNGDAGRLPKRLVGLVWQDDLLLPNLTVEETVYFAARLKNDDCVPDGDVRSAVDRTLARLGLDKVRRSLVGGGGGGMGGGGGGGLPRGVSGGERKRVAVAVELVGRPSVLLLDEPTSGLDSASARSLVSILKELTREGHSVAAVVHQPRTEIFEMFDDLLLLSRGRTVYRGRPEFARGILEACPGVRPLPPQTGIADWIMDVVTEDEGRSAVGGALADHWRDSDAASACVNVAKESFSAEGGGAGGRTSPAGAGAGAAGARRPALHRRRSTLAVLNAGPKFKSSFVVQLRLLSVRSVRQNRGERITRVSLYYTAAYTLFTSALWFRLPDDPSRVYQRLSLLFFFIIAQSVSIVTTSMTTFHRERALLSRERAKKMYGVLPYFLAKTLSDMTTTVFLPTLYGCVTYPLTNLRPTVPSFLSFAFALYLTLSAAQSCGLFLSVAIPNLRVGLTLAPVVSIFLMILAGFYVPLDRLPPSVEWASWLSFARYGFSAMVVNEFGGRDVPCAEGEEGEDGGGRASSAAESSSASASAVAVLGGTAGEEACPLPGEDVIGKIGIDGAFANLWTNLGILVAMQIVLRGACYVQLRRSK